MREALGVQLSAQLQLSELRTATATALQVTTCGPQGMTGKVDVVVPLAAGSNGGRELFRRTRRSCTPARARSLRASRKRLAIAIVAELQADRGDAVAQVILDDHHRGNPRDLPAPPKYTEGWGIGEPDAVLALLKMEFVTGETIRVDGGRHIR